MFEDIRRLYRYPPFQIHPKSRVWNGWQWFELKAIHHRFGASKQRIYSRLSWVFFALLGTVWLRSPRRKRWLWGKHPGHLIPRCDSGGTLHPMTRGWLSFSQYKLGIQKYTDPVWLFFFYNWVATTRYTGGLFLDLRIFSCKFGRDETNIIQRVSWTRLWWGCSTSFEVSMHISETTQNKFLWERVFGHAQITRHKDLKKTCRTRKRVLPSIVSRG